jgi:hypothetical protein
VGADPLLARLAVLAAGVALLVAVAALLAATPTGRRRRPGRVAAQRPTSVAVAQAPWPYPTPRFGSAPAARPTPDHRDRGLGFSLVVVADPGQQPAELTAALWQLARLDQHQLQILAVVADDDPAARAAAEAAHRRHPDRIAIVTGHRRPPHRLAGVDRALAACRGAVTGVLGPAGVHPELLGHVADLIGRRGAAIVQADTQLQSCWWSASPAIGRDQVRVAPRPGQVVFVPTDLLRPPPATHTTPPPNAGESPISTQPVESILLDGRRRPLGTRRHD